MINRIFNTHIQLKYFILVIIVLFISNSAISQNCELNNKKAKKQYDKAVTLLKSRLKNDKLKGIKQMHDIVKDYPDYYIASFTLGYIYKEKTEEAYRNISKTNSLKPMQKYQGLSARYFMMSSEVCQEYRDYSANYELGAILYEHNEFEKALKYLDPFYKNGQKHKEYDLGVNMYERCEAYVDLISNPIDYNPEQVEGVSTYNNEYLPLISPDGEYIFYTRRVEKQASDEFSSKSVEEFTYSKRVNSMDEVNPEFSEGITMPAPFNKGQNQGAISISIDNKYLYITICNTARKRTSSGTFKNCDIFVSHNNGGEWTAPKNLGPNINGLYSWESQPSISADGKTLFFASMRATNIGVDIQDVATFNVDIYSSTKDEVGNWQPAVNLGESINTIGDDKSPFMHSDSQTLYYATNGRFGVGGFDIYYSKKINDSTWSQPKNIGYPINSENDEVGLIVSTNGEKAYFSSNKLGKGNVYNVYSFDLYEDARPKRVFFAKGTALDENDNVIKGATIEIKSTISDIVTEAVVDSSTGDYAIAVALESEDEELLMTVKKEDFAFTSVYLKPKEQQLLTVPKNINFKMKKVEIGKKVEINNIYFATSSAIFDKASMFVLNNFMEYLQDNPKLKIRIEGHTDNVGDAKENQVLSEKRAKAVRDYLILMGVDISTIVAYKGYGQTKPIASNKTEEGRAKNRRTEFVIVGK